MNIAVIGSGYVGLTATVCLAEIGHDVVCIDRDAERVGRLSRGEAPIHERHLPELLRKHLHRSIRFTHDIREAVKNVDAVMIAVGTPTDDSGKADVSAVESVACELAHSITGYTLVIEKSTVPVCTSEWIRKVMVRNGCPPDSFDVVSNPEFLREGSAIEDFLYPDRIIIGSDNDRGYSGAHEIYRPLIEGTYYRAPGVASTKACGRCNATVIRTCSKSAELVKHASNAFLAMKISFVNTLANLCEEVGADISEVKTGIGADSRIGSAFLNPGIGYGGSCFPKDLKAFHTLSRESGIEFDLLQDVVRVNDAQRARFMAKIRKALWSLKGKRIAALGLAFKAGTDDIRESPAIQIIRMLLREGCTMAAYDPAAKETARAALQGNNVVFASDSYEAAEGADALLVLTDWPEFASLDLHRVKRALLHPLVIDGRNIFDPQAMAAAGFHYYSIGRADVRPLPVLVERRSRSSHISTAASAKKRTAAARAV
jgi:UDPglucose 6-dehydrogenase